MNVSRKGNFQVASLYLKSMCAAVCSVSVCITPSESTDYSPDLSGTTTVTRTAQIANDEHTQSYTIMITVTMPEKYK